MSNRTGLLVVNRIWLLHRAMAAGVLSKRRPALDLTPEEAFRRYRGFDGEPWPDRNHPEFQTEDGLASVAQELAVVDYVRRLPNAEDSELIALAPVGVTQLVVSSGWIFAGFDVGYFESEWSHFSIVLSEVLWGVCDELRLFAGRLNEHLLFWRREDAQALLELHHRLAQQGERLEEGEFEPISIFLKSR